MSSCCSIADSEARACPQCGHTGPVVGAAPVRPHRAHAPEGGWQHCDNGRCGVVYYLADDIVEVDAVITQVGAKATDKPVPVCFCFAHTPEALADDLAANDGVSTIKAQIKAAVAEGHCACEHLNPSGKCCLADVHRALKAVPQPTSA